MRIGQLKLPVLLAFAVVFVATGAIADPCLMVYSDSPVIYHYESAEHYTVTMGDPLYDPAFDRNGEVLIETGTNDIAYDVYQAPNLIGFELDEENQGYFIVGTSFTAIVDGFNNAPTTYVNILLVFDMFEPDGCVPLITVDGNPVLFDPGLGFYWPVGDLVVTTPTAMGNNFSDTMSFSVEWSGCSGVRTYAFADDNFNLMRDGGECFSAFSHDLVIPTEDSTWGAIKDMYKE